MKRVSIVILAVLILFSGCNSGILSPKIELPVSQTRNDVERIELLVTKRHDALLKEMTVVATLSGTDAEQFWDALQKIEVERDGYAPASFFGKLAISIYYKDGNYDVLGTESCAYFYKDFVWSSDACYLNYQDTKELFTQYVNDNLLPIYP